MNACFPRSRCRPPLRGRASRGAHQILSNEALQKLTVLGRERTASRSFNSWGGIECICTDQINCIVRNPPRIGGLTETHSAPNSCQVERAGNQPVTLQSIKNFQLPYFSLLTPHLPTTFQPQMGQKSVSNIEDKEL